MNLFGGKQWPIADADCAPDFAMRHIEPLNTSAFSRATSMPGILSVKTWRQIPIALSAGELFE